jgi:hypothetical protein
VAFRNSLKTAKAAFGKISRNREGFDKNNLKNIFQYLRKSGATNEENYHHKRSLPRPGKTFITKEHY